MTTSPTGWSTELGRHVSAGVAPAVPTLAPLPAWWGAGHWLDVEIPCALASAGELLREEHVSRGTLMLVARAHARYADTGSGRNCRPTNERLAALAHCHVRTVQRARRVLKRLQLLVEVRRGRSFMTRAERLAAWRRGSSHRKIAAEFALTSHRHPQGAAAGCGACHPTPRSVGNHVPNLKSGFFRERDRSDDGAARRLTRRSGPRRPIAPATLKAQRLTAGVQRRLSWLRAASPRRLTSLHRFAAQGWTPRDVHEALDGVLRSRRWSVPNVVTNPPAYLATLLRDLDPADRPGAYREAMLEHERERRAWLWYVEHQAAHCPHGEPAGNEPNPLTGVRSCPLCRRA